MQQITENISTSTKYEADIAQQEKQIAALEQIVAQKEGELLRISQEYESAAKDLKASIHYAERIQRAVIPYDTEFKALFGDCFIYFNPKDIVSGDFYTCASSPDFKIAIVADCTGHGVPGGLLSMLGMSALKDILPAQNIAAAIDPATVLDLLRKFFLTSLAEESETDDSTVRDGMDISYCVFNKEMTQMRYACANHTVYVARGGEIFKLKGSRMPIGRYPKQDEPFESFTFNLQKGDMVYLCSDGIQDQFGSPDNIKFTTKRLAAMLLEHSELDTQRQYDDIAKIVSDWKGNLEQYDDQTLIGIRI
ncbi:MAG: SpoIIE family protein phosphatase [Bacteroidales bacterium]|nr:SpoIIE family protein phosphatase [Bacteroidales bacterium]